LQKDAFQLFQEHYSQLSLDFFNFLSFQALSFLILSIDHSSKEENLLFSNCLKLFEKDETKRTVFSKF
jgi:hypothetical protein